MRLKVINNIHFLVSHTILVCIYISARGHVKIVIFVEKCKNYFFEPLISFNQKSEHELRLKREWSSASHPNIYSLLIQQLITISYRNQPSLSLSLSLSLYIYIYIYIHRGLIKWEHLQNKKTREQMWIAYDMRHTH